MKPIWKIALIGSILLTLVLVGVAYALKPLPSPSAQPMPPLRDLLLHPNELCDHVAECEEIEIGEEYTEESVAKETAEFIGLPTDYQEGVGFYVVVYAKHNFPQAVLQALYRYGSEEEAIARYEQLLKGLPDTPLGRGTPIIRTYEWPFQEGKGQVVEAQDPAGTAYWFIGTQGDRLMVLVVLSEGTKGQPVFAQLVPLMEAHMAALR
jgi:hypothetical protein